MAWVLGRNADLSRRWGSRPRAADVSGGRRRDRHRRGNRASAGHSMPTVELFRLVAEARRIKLAYLFDPMLAITSSQIDPLPHQIQAVYGQMLPRQPLRYLLADDPGAGKTIMAGLYIKELMLRGDAKRVLVVAPGSLVGQWQDEFYETISWIAFRALTGTLSWSTKHIACPPISSPARSRRPVGTNWAKSSVHRHVTSC